jgi:hypothetical protein
VLVIGHADIKRCVSLHMFSGPLEQFDGSCSCDLGIDDEQGRLGNACPGLPTLRFV